MTPLLRVERVSKRYGGLVAVRDVSFEVQEGRIAAIIGPNGAGKSTLFHLLTGFERPDGGDVWFRGQRITGLQPFQIARLGIARTFQTPELFRELTVYETLVTAGLQRLSLAAARAQAERVLTAMHMESRRNAPVRELTAASQKRLEVARAMATGARLLLLDEALAGLTESEIRKMIDVIRRLRDTGHTIVIVEHVMRVVMELCEQIIVLNFGEKIADGSPTDVSQDPAVVEAYLGSE